MSSYREVGASGSGFTLGVFYEIQDCSVITQDVQVPQAAAAQNLSGSTICRHSLGQIWVLAADIFKNNLLNYNTPKVLIFMF